MDSRGKGLGLPAAGLLALLAGTAAGLALWALQPARLWEIREIQLELRSNRADTVRFQCDTGKGYDQHPLMLSVLLPSPQFQKAVFLLPGGTRPRQCRFSPSDQAGEVAIRSLTLSSWLHSRRLSAAEIAALIQPDSNLSAWTLDGDTLRLTLAGRGAPIQFAPGDYWHPPFPRSPLALILAAAMAVSAFFFWVLRHLGDPAWKRSVIALCLAALAALAGFLWLRQIQFNLFNPAPRLFVTLQIPADGHYEVFFDLGWGFNSQNRVSLRLRGAETYQTAVFKLPELFLPQNLRFDPGQQPGRIRIRSLRLQTSLKTLQWQAADLPVLFAPLSQVAQRLEGDALVLESTGTDPYLVGTSTLQQQLQDLSRLYNRWRKAILACLVAMLFFTVFFFLASWPALDRMGQIHWADLGLAAAFILIISLPMANQWLRFAHDIESSEKRALAERPDFKLAYLTVFPRLYEPYFNDHFPFRNQLVRWNSLLRVKLLRTSPSRLVLIGRQGWWYLRQNALDPGTGLDDYLGLTPFSAEEVASLLRRLQAQNDWCRARGIQLVFVLCPNKPWIYPEYLPRGYRRLAAPSRLDQLLEQARLRSSLRIVDCRPALLAAKQRHPVFLQKDVHWNSFGAFTGYTLVARELQRTFPEIRPVEDNEARFTFTIQKQVGWAYDLVGLLNASQSFEDIFCEASITAPPREGRFPSILAFHDSMFYGMQMFFEANGGRLRMIHHDWKPLSDYYAQILEQRPAVVIYEIVENRLNRLLE